METINVYSLIEISRLVRMKAIAKYWANDYTIMVDTRINEKKSKAPEYRRKCNNYNRQTL